MLTMDVFKQDAFSAISMSAAVDKIDYVPQMLDGMPGLFTPEPVRTTSIMIEERSTGFVILPFSPRGTAPHQTGGDKRKIRNFETLRISDASRITASELMAIRAFGSETELMQLQGEVMRRQFKMKQNFALTREFHKLNCATTAKVLDANGDVMYDWATEFGQTIPAEIDFDLDNASPAVGALRKKCNSVVRSVTVNLKGGVAQRIVGLCGDNFWDDLVTNPEVEKTYLNWSAAEQTRNETVQPWSRPMRFGNIDWINYRGTDNGTSVAIGTDKVKFFPVGAGIFRWAMSPGESFAHVNTLGQDTYSNIVTDKDRDTWADVEAYQYPLPVCVMPSALHQGRRT